MAAMVFGVSPLDPAVIGGAILFLAAVAGTAAYLPARQASSLAPQQVLM
jgi:ABC-type lipoprotein release transport system permease subunit